MADTTLKFILLGEDRTGKAWKSAASGMDVLSKKSQDVGKSLSLGVTLPLVGIAAAGVKTAADFDTTMASMQVNAGASAEKMEELRALAMKLGADTVYSAGEAADAMLELSKGGLETADIQGGALAATMNLAATEGMGLADAATIMTQAMNTFSVDAKDAAKVTDLLAAGAVASTAGVADLAAGMKYVGSTAASLHMPLEDTVTALAALNNAGIDSTTAGTSLNRMLLGLAAPSKNAGKAFEKFGVSATDANGKVLDMAGMIAQLQDKLGNLSDTDRSEALKQMFGVEGMRAANVLMKDGVKGWDELSAKVNKGGVAAEMANARMTGINGAIEQMKGSAETAALTIGDALAPKVIFLAGALKKGADWFTGLSDGARSTIVTLGLVAAAVGPVLWAFGKTIEAGKSIVSGFQMAGRAYKVLAANARVLTSVTWSGVKATAASAIGWVKNTASLVAHKVATLAVATATKVVTAAQWLLNAAMTANPVGLVVAALVGLGAALFVLWKKSDTFRNGVTKVFSAIAVGVLGLVKVWLKGLQFMSGLFLTVVGVIVKGAAKAFGWVPGVGPKLKAAADGFDKFKAGVRGSLDKAINKVDQWQQSVKNMPKRIELKGKIDDLKAKIDDAKKRLKDKKLTEPEKAKIRADISNLEGQVAKAQKKLDGIKGPKVDVAVNFKIKGRTYEIPGSGTYDAFTGKRIKGPSGGLGQLTPRAKVDNPSRGSSRTGHGLMSLTHGKGAPGARWNARGPMWSWHRGPDGQGHHNGVDLVAPGGTPVYTTRGGTIVHRGYGGSEGSWAGNNVIERLSSGVKLVFAHLSQSSATGHVGAGARIGNVGSTGNSSGNHLHVSAIKGGTYVNPIPYLADGGIVRYRPGGTLAVIGERPGYDEAVIPLPKSGAPAALAAHPPIVVQLRADGRMIQEIVTTYEDRTGRYVLSNQRSA